MDKCKTGLGYNVIPPPYIGNFMPHKHDLIYPSLDDFVEVNESASEFVVEKPTIDTNEPTTARKEDGVPIIELGCRIPVNTVQLRTTVNNAGPMKNVINNAYSTARRPFNKITAADNSDFNKRVNTVNDKNVNATRPNAVVNTARPKAVLSVVKGNKGNAVKASACWVWRPKHKVLDHGNPQQDLKDKGVIDSGCSRHMTGNRSYFTDYEEIDGGFVAFGGNPKEEDYWEGKFDGKANEGFFMGYSTNSKAFRVFNGRTRIVEENLHVKLMKSTKACDNAGKARMETIPGKYYILLPLSIQDPPFSSSSKDSPDARFKPSGEEEKNDAEDPRNEDSEVPEVNVVDPKTSIELPNDPNMPKLEDIVYLDDDEDVGAEADMNNLDAFMPVSPIPTTRIHKDHPVEQIIGDLNSAPQTRRMTKSVTKQAMFSSVQQRTNHKDFQNCLFACFLLQEEPKKVWTLVDLPNGKRAIGSKWVYRNKKDERGIVIKNKARLVAQGYTQEEGIDYDEVFAPVARIEAIRLFLAYASFKDFVVYQMDIKSAFPYGKIEEEVCVCQPPRFEDPDFPNRVYKVEKALYGLHQAPKAWYETLSTYLLDNRFQRGKIDKTLYIRRDKGDILLVQVYIDDIIFGSTKKSLCTDFEKMIHKKFQMSSMGELTFFLGLRVK
ncbi:putative ribonuclease H-like domain-containing protein [Tanacetum coccineum]